MIILATFSITSRVPAVEYHCRSRISAGDARLFSLPDLPDGATVRLCTAPDKDGISGNLEFDADPDATRLYLKSMGMSWDLFFDVPVHKVKDLSAPRGEGWNLKEGEKYRWNFVSHSWKNGCLMSYTAFIPAEKQWDGKAYIGFFCMR
ncbi:hypothetical protein [Streptomyces sp. NPDC005141]